jgi:hypothetical protein
MPPGGKVAVASHPDRDAVVDPELANADGLSERSAFHTHE